MLIVTGLIEVAPEGAAAAARAAMAMVAETNKEPGCLVYEFSQVLGNAARFRVYEEWEDEAALVAHGASPHMAIFRKALAGVGVVSRDIVKIEAGERTSLG